ncbi:hypothetical protein LUZ60_009916 [Juncus effusus]|nr:hypothetical protein LUZ60_009916 [Juncus effusus]
MENKRTRGDQEEDSKIPRENQIRKSPFFSTIKQAMAVNFQKNMVDALEPVIRKVVREEVQHVLSLSPLSVDRKPQMEMISPEKPLYHLIFKNQPDLPIFSLSKIEDTDGSSLQILLVADLSNSSSSESSSLPSQIKIELVVLDGDFPRRDDWTSDEFNKAIVKERVGRRPLLTGVVNNITMRNQYVRTGELQFTDNSSWTRSRHFRIGVRVVQGSCEAGLIKEAITDKFVVKDHRGESYKKHHPPGLADEVYRLEKIAKGGVFHKRLAQNNIFNVQDLLKLWAVNPGQLREIFGPGMSDSAWKTTINHAKTCDLGNKIYIYSQQNVTIFLDSICQVVNITIDGVPYTFKDLNRNNRDYVRQLVLAAYKEWGNLREADEMINGNISQIQSETVVQGGSGFLQTDNYNNPQEYGTEDFPTDLYHEEGNFSGSLGYPYSQLP